jgi:hypothetical protein
MTSVASRRLPFGLSIGSILSSFILIGGVQALIAGLRAPLSLGAVQAINWILGKASAGAKPLRVGAAQWSVVTENLVLSARFCFCGFAIGSWLRRDPR